MKVKQRVAHGALTAVLLGVVLSWGSHAVAQGTSGSITGRVTDESGAVMPGVTVEVIHPETSLTRTAVTDADGAYLVTPLGAGVYTVIAALEGFTTANFPDIRLDALATVRIDVQLAVGELAESVVVDAAAPVVESEVAMLADVKDQRALTDLPMNIRGGAASYQWTWLVPTGTQGSGSSRSFGGGRSTMNNFNVDGISTSSPAFGNELERLQPPREAVQEVRFEYANSRAEFGSIANVTAISRSGSNEIHGSGFWSTFPGSLVTRDFFATEMDERPSSRDDLYGGSIGGPISRDKAFFFLAYEGNRLQEERVLAPDVPTARMRQGDFSELLNLSTRTAILDPLTQEPFPNNVIPADRLNQGALAWQDRLYPLPNFGPPSLMSGNYRGAFPLVSRLAQVDTRVDYHFSPGNTVYGRVGFTSAPRDTLGELPPESSGYGNNTQRGFTGTLSHTWALSSRMVNEAKVGMAKRTIDSCCERPIDARQAIDMLGIQGLPPVQDLRALPGISISGISEVAGGAGSDENEWSYQFMNHLSYMTGRHLFKAGVEYRWSGHGERVFPDLGTYQFTNGFTGHAYADFLLGLPQTTTRTLERPAAERRFSTLALFVQDDFKILPRLTVYYGARWQYDQPAYEQGNIVSNFDPAIGALVVPDENALRGVHPLFPSAIPIVTAAEAGYPTRSLRRGDLNNVAPRLGFAFRPFNNTRTAIRGGYGIFYGDFTLSVASPIYAASPFGLPERFVNSITNGAPELTLQQPFRQAGDPGAVQVSAVSRDLVNPYLHQWNLTLEQEIPFRSSVRLSYVGTKGTDLVYSRDINQPLASPEPFSQDRRPFPYLERVSMRENGGRSLYHSLTLEFKRRMHQGVQFQVAWTLAKSLVDAIDSGGEGGPTIENAYDLRRQRGNAPTTPRHRVVGTVIWEIPVGEGRRFLDTPGLASQILGGWQVSGIFLGQTGLYLTPMFSGADPSNTRSFSGVPDRLCDGQLPASERSLDRWFDPSCFAVPSNGRFGNAGWGILRGPGRWNVNLGLFKTFRVMNGNALRLEITANNALNHTNFDNPDLNISNTGTVGRITSSFGGGRNGHDFTGPREIMVGVRYQF